MRSIEYIVLHCSDSDIEAHDNVETIRSWHLERGWRDIGYHFVITKDGSVDRGRDINLPGAHAKGFNSRSIGICLTGRDWFSPEQFASLRELCDDLLEAYDLDRSSIVLHRELNSGKTCPNFDFDDVFS